MQFKGRHQLKRLVFRMNPRVLFYMCPQRDATMLGDPDRLSAPNGSSNPKPKLLQSLTLQGLPEAYFTIWITVCATIV